MISEFICGSGGTAAGQISCHYTGTGAGKQRTVHDPITDRELWYKTNEQLSFMPPEMQQPSDELLTDIRRLNNEIERDLQILNVDSDSLQEKIYECAARQYQLNRIIPRESMGFQNTDPCSPDFIRNIKKMVASVQLIDDHTISLKRISD